MNDIIADLLKNPDSVSLLKVGLPQEFKMAEAEATRIYMRGNVTHLATGHDVGFGRERVILGYLRSCLGEKNVKLPQPEESVGDARVGDIPLEIKTVTGNAEVTYKWNVDSASVDRTMKDLQFTANMWLVRIWWGKERKSIFYIPKKVLMEKREEFKPFWRSSAGTNNRGVKLKKEFMEAAESDERTLTVDIKWPAREQRMLDPIDRYEQNWTKLKSDLGLD